MNEQEMIEKIFGRVPKLPVGYTSWEIMGWGEGKEGEHDGLMVCSWSTFNGGWNSWAIGSFDDTMNYFFIEAKVDLSPLIEVYKNEGFDCFLDSIDSAHKNGIKLIDLIGLIMPAVESSGFHDDYYDAYQTLLEAFLKRLGY